MYNKMQFFTLILIISIVIPTWGNVINIPGDKPTIQAGINSAMNGDTVLVAPGIYYENINFLDKNIVVASHYILNCDTSFISSTVIDGSQPTHPDTGSCVIIGPGHDSTTVLEGFTLTGGTGTVWQDLHDLLFYREGGGILVDLSSPIIKNNFIVENEAINKSSITSAGGGGIRCGDSNPLIENNIVKQNRGLYGAGIVLFYSTGRVRKNIVAQNSGGEDFGGGGLWIVSGGITIVENNTIVENIVTGTGNLAGRGGGILTSGKNLIARNNIVWNNEQTQGGQVVASTSSIIIYNDIQGGWQGLGNIDQDPLFADTSYTLSPNSPCIDAGDPDSPLDPDGTRADIGAVTYYHLDTPYIWIASHTIDDGQGNNNGRADTGETVNLIVALINTSLDVTGVSATLSTNDPDIQIIQATSDYGGLVRDQSRSNQGNPFSFSVSSATTIHPSIFNLSITADNGYATSDSFEIVIGTPTILLIDDDGGDLYEAYYTNLILPEVWNVSLKGCPSLELLQDYQTVIWFTGNDRDSVLTDVEQSLIAAFLDGGGRLLITGQDIGYSLMKTGSASDSAFYNNYLHAQFISDSSNSDKTLGVSGDIITGGMFVYFTGSSGGAGNQTAPDEITPIAPAQVILKYIPSFSGAGLRFEDENTGSRLVYLAFGFEGITGPQNNTASLLLEKILTWLMGTTSIENNLTESNIPKICLLNQNYPNPFNPTTIIEYAIPQTGFVTLKIYDILGREIKTLVSKNQQSGNYKLVFDGKNLESGIYLYKLRFKNFEDTKKFILLK